MNNLPEYLEKILRFMAECEEKQGGMKKEQAYQVFKSELLNESLTAKANPEKRNPGKTRKAKHMTEKDFDKKDLAEGAKHEMEHTDNLREAKEIAMDHLAENKDYYRMLSKLEIEQNPTKIAFNEMYTVFGDRFSQSSLGEKLKFKKLSGNFRSKKRVQTGTTPEGKPIYDVEKIYDYSGKGNELFEDIRKLSVKISNLVMENLFSEKTKREAGVVSAIYGSGSKDKKYAASLASGEYEKGMKSTVYDNETGRTYQDVIERNRYIKLLINSLVVGLLEPILDIDPKSVRLLMRDFIGNKKGSSLTLPKARQQFIKNILELLKERDGIVKASLNASYSINKSVKAPDNVISQILIIDAIKNSTNVAKVVPANEVIKKGK